MAEWVNAELSLDPVLGLVEPIIQTVDSLLSALIQILNVVQKILDVIKVFIVGLLDPIRAIVEAIVTEIRNLLADLRQIGLYFHGDWKLVTAGNNFQDVLGGYAAYEQRMIARLLNTQDSNRPNFSPSTTVLGAFLYVSSQDVGVIVRAMKALLNLLGRADLMGTSPPYTTPTTPTMKFGQSLNGTASFRGIASQSSPDAVSVTWTMPPSANKSRILAPTPKGFLIHVSTIPDGFNLISLTPNPISGNPNTPPWIISGGVDPIGNGPLKLYGGVADLGTDLEESTDAQAPRLYLQVDQNTPLIKPSLLTENGPLIANTFFVKMSALSPQRLGGSTQFTALFKKSDLPKAASFKVDGDGYAAIDGNPVEGDRYWFRVRAVTDNFVSASGLTGGLNNPSSVFDSKARLYHVSRDTVLTARGTLTPESACLEGATPAIVSFSDVTKASAPSVAIFPTPEQETYLRAVQTALAIAILCRVDLTGASSDAFEEGVYAPGFSLGNLELLGRRIYPGLNSDFYREMRPQKFRSKVLKGLFEYIVNLPPSETAHSITESTKDLLSFRWKDMNSDYPDLTIIDSLGSPQETFGIGANPLCRSIPQGKLLQDYAYNYNDTVKDPIRPPSFMLKSPEANYVWVEGEGSADYSPVIYNDQPGHKQVAYVRNVLTDWNGGSLITQAGLVLGTLVGNQQPTGDDTWKALRLFPQALVPLDEVLTRLDRFMQGVLDGLQGIIDQIVAYIEALQARIYQLQALLELIQALLNSLDFFRLPSMSALILTGEGTNGLVTELVTADNKPTDSSNAYGAGVVLVAGGIPTILLDLLALILGGQ